jgi:hypothetical protein
MDPSESHRYTVDTEGVVIKNRKKKSPSMQTANKTGEIFDYVTYLLQNHWGAIPAVHASNPTPILHAALRSFGSLEFLSFLMIKVDRCAEVIDDNGNYLSA